MFCPGREYFKAVLMRETYTQTCFKRAESNVVTFSIKVVLSDSFIDVQKVNICPMTLKVFEKVYLQILIQNVLFCS